MPVIDPTYQNFDYGAALRLATSGIDRLGEGRLAYSQIEGQRAFETARDQKLSDLSQRREAANETLRAAFQKQAETDRLNQQQNIHLDEVARQKGETRKDLFATARRADPSFNVDEEATGDANEERAKKTIADANLDSYKSLVGQRKALNAKRDALIEKAGGMQPVDERQVSAMLANDPSLVSLLTPAQRDQLRSGAITAEQISNSFWRTGNKQTLLQAAQDARTKLQDLQRQATLSKLGAEGSELNSRYDEINQAITKVGSALEPSQLGQAYKDTGVSPPAPAVASDGLALGIGTPKATGQSAVAGVPAGTPVNRNPNYYAALAGYHQETANHQNIDAQISSLQDKLDKGGATTFIPSTGGSGYSSFTPSFQKYGVDKMGELSKQLLKLQKQKEDSADALTGYSNTLKGIDPTFGTPQAQPQPVPQSTSPAFTPLPQTPGSTVDFNNLPPNLFNQSNQVNQGIQSATAQPPMFPSPAPQPAPIGGQQITLDPPDGTQPAPGGIPGAANAMQSMAIQNKINAAAGTSDPNALTRAKAYMHNQLQWDDQKVQSHIAGVIQGDPSAIQVFRAIVQRAQAGNSMSPPAVQPQPAFPTQPLQ